ncbi:hypothetical protein [Burkholderia lata]|uniref:hypothetical protein n=1 Tax=Burkholderia lata (strain ATCC 17760 / DSM 23089 / LMG 22485 / NCIMB 9086 / R18194 / 383) TaxID=482957 RepID=UPI00399A4D88
MNDMTNLVMLLIAMHGGGVAPASAYRYAVVAQGAAEKRQSVRTDAVFCKDRRVHTFPAGHPKPCI